MPPYCAGAVFCLLKLLKNKGCTQAGTYLPGTVFIFLWSKKKGSLHTSHCALPVHLQNIWYPHSRHTTAMEITIKFSVISIPNTIPTPIKNSINPVSFPISVSLLFFSYYSICRKTRLSTVSCFYSSVSPSESPPAPGTKRFTKSGTISRTLVRPS